ncbi:alpha-hydroxy-acid oxidizing protein [Clostridium sp. D2Q-14]|uniref:alpha-hydroxy-acid oxidizing protein n=1 Tax=Anaeromonas gelatinilytica TaxID=2683194 RepID=UPI00193C832D|nr:alpha-hydroxy-acid oxidizing protein [Anaeromonas gelatinilytica]MBS4536268.1 alpha-hydroxy-acid oxidizing protein [Anaeromonas gelatinilytica]
MDIDEIRKEARNKMKGYCRVCPVCNGVACAGEVPGMGGSLTAQSFKNNIEELKKIKLVLKTIHNTKKPDTSIELFGQKLSMPIISAPITGSSFNMGGALTEAEYVDAVMKGSIEAGTIAMTGDTADASMYQDGLKGIESVNGKGIPIIKPRENKAILEKIKMAEAINPLAIGVDIDGAGLVTMALKGQPVGPKAKNELKELINSTNLPFILKGIMTVEEAKMAVEIGAKSIVVSNHGGRILDHINGVAKGLPDIAKAVKGKITILADGGIRSGIDVFKMIALGADAILIGRPIIIGAYGGYEEGVKLTLEKMQKELLQAMILTGNSDILSIDYKSINI